MNSSFKLPELSQVVIDDSLWNHYYKLVADVIIPYQWRILNDMIPDAEPSHCLNNFKIAAGEMKGQHKGTVFIDTDVYKWLESVAYCIHNGTGKQYENIADEIIELIGRAQQEDGYLNTYYTLAEPNSRWTNLIEGHELYCAGHLLEAAVAYYNATGKDRLLNIARRLADLICEVFGTKEGQIKGYPGHQEIELALVKLYRTTEEKKYLECAKYFIEERGSETMYFKSEIKKRDEQMLFDEFRDYDLKYSQAHVPVREQKSMEGHAVRATYMCCAMADLSLEYNDEKMFEACKTLWHSITQKRMYITGGIGSSGHLERFTTDYHLPNSSGYCETCASIGLALFGRRMFMIEQDSEYYDTVERVLYNTLLAGVGIDGEHYFYVNPLEVWPEACIVATSLGHVKPVRQRWFSVACCPTNAARTLASLSEYIYSMSKDTLFINLYISSSISTMVTNEDLKLKLDSGILQDGKVKITIKSNKEKNSCIALRIPDYAAKPLFAVNGGNAAPEIKDGYAYFKGMDSESEIEIDFNVKPRWVSANTNVREDEGKAALMKGPCVYCLEETDNGTNLASIFADIKSDITESQDDALPGNLKTLNYRGYRLKNKNEGKLYSEAKFEFEPVKVKAVPYGVWGNREKGEMLVWQKLKH